MGTSEKTNIVDLLEQCIAFQDAHTFLQHLIVKAHLFLDLPHGTSDVVNHPVRVSVPTIIVISVFVRGLISLETRIDVPGGFDVFDGFVTIESVALPLLDRGFGGGSAANRKYAQRALDLGVLGLWYWEGIQQGRIHWSLD